VKRNRTGMLLSPQGLGDGTFRSVQVPLLEAEL
jgi:hypothetical protein